MVQERGGARPLARREEDLTGSGAAPATDLGPWLSLGHLSVSHYGIGNVYGGWPSHKRQNLLAKFLLTYVCTTLKYRLEVHCTASNENGQFGNSRVQRLR